MRLKLRSFFRSFNGFGHAETFLKLHTFSPFVPVASSLSAHTEHTRLATFTKLPSGFWRAQVRRKGRYISETFAYREDARRWASEAERSIDQGKAPKTTRIADKTTFGHLVDLHLDDRKAIKSRSGAPPFLWFESEYTVSTTTAYIRAAKAAIAATEERR